LGRKSLLKRLKHRKHIVFICANTSFSPLDTDLNQSKRTVIIQIESSSFKSIIVVKTVVVKTVAIKNVAINIVFGKNDERKSLRFQLFNPISRLIS